MSTTQLFKNTSNNVHRRRYMTNEDQFSKGMQFTNAPLASGYAKALINFDLKNDGTSLVPRGGLHDVQSRLASVLYSLITPDYFIHHSDAAYVSNYDETDAYLCNYFILTTVQYGLKPSGVYPCGDTYSAKMVLEYNGQYLIADYDWNHANATAGYMLMQPAVTQMQDLKTVASLDNNYPYTRNGIHTSLEGNTYVFIRNTDSVDVHKEVYSLGKVVIKLNEDADAFTWHIEEVEPYEVQPTQAMNYGYNMLKTHPYTFTNSVSATGAVQLTGVLPYSETGDLLLTARAGTPMVFKLYYKYPQIDVDNSDKYLVQWEIQDLNSNSNAQVIKKVRGSTEYTPGADITFAYTPTYKAFSIIVRLYKKSEITAQDAAWDNDEVLQKLVTKDDNLTPNQVTTLASYYLTGNSDTSMLNVTPSEYQVASATGMCTWQQRIVLWGVEGAKSTLFVSEINNPAYFPYPNNCEIFSNDIICAIPYMSSLLVFTTTALYKLTFNDDGLTYVSECIQERLNMIPSDINTVVTVQNMVYFKSGNYFYMVVPNNQLTSQTGVQLAPVSRMVEQMFDNMGATLAKIINEVYDLSFDGYHNPIDLKLVDYNVQIANTQIRNIYKVAVKRSEGAGTDKTYYFDISLNYDTVLRAWTVYTWETTVYRDCIFKSTVTGENILIHLFNVGDGTHGTDKVYVSLIQADSQRPADDIELVDGNKCTFGNWQLISTGYRDFAEDFKKRFREVQFCVNLYSTAVLKFNTAFVVDDVEKVPMYKHVVSQITDKNDPNYGVIFIDRELYNEIGTPNISDFNDWEFDTAIFPDITMHKIRYKVSGKGYGGAVKILSKNEVPFELLHINWVYRIMFAR